MNTLMCWPWCSDCFDDENFVDSDCKTNSLKQKINNVSTIITPINRIEISDSEVKLDQTVNDSLLFKRCSLLYEQRRLCSPVLFKI